MCCGLAIADRAFPAASVAVTSHGKLVALKAFGHFTYEIDSPEVTTASVFDLASVSKVVATTSHGHDSLRTRPA